MSLEFDIFMASVCGAALFIIGVCFMTMVIKIHKRKEQIFRDIRARKKVYKRVGDTFIRSEEVTTEDWAQIKKDFSQIKNDFTSVFRDFETIFGNLQNAIEKAEKEANDKK